MTDWKSNYPLSIALVHYPVRDKTGMITATSTTNFDVHDLARVARTYGLAQYYIVTPVPSQVWFVERIVNHWTEGFGATYNPTRKEAMRTIHLMHDLSEVAEHIEKEREREPVFVATSAKALPNHLSFDELAGRVKGEMQAPSTPPREYCLVFGTGWGIAPILMEEMDYFLEPVKSTSDGYNHLSVRAAVAIIIDRVISRI